MKTDTELQQDVCAELLWEPSVQAGNIGVAAHHGVITLTGRVSTFAQKWRAEEAALRVSGVHGLAVEIDVQLPALGRPNDADLAQSVERALEWVTPLLVDAVQVSVEDGWITLRGELDWHYQRQSVVDAVRNLSGIRGVSNQICITPPVNADAVQADIEAALLRHAHLDAQRIHVAVNGNAVTLTGTVDSWAERQAATDSAWRMAGVGNVVDHMRPSA